MMSQLLLAMLLFYGVAFPTIAQPTRVSQAMTSIHSVSSFQISPDQRFAVYRVFNGSTAQSDLFSVRLSSGVVTALSLPAPDAQIGLFKISADSKRVVYSSSLRSGATRNSLYSVAIDDPGSRILLSDRVRQNTSFEITPDSFRVLFICDEATESKFSLVYALISTPVIVDLSGAFAPGAGDGVTNFQLSRNGSQVYFQGDLNVADRHEIFRTNVVGGSRILLSGDLSSAGATAEAFALSPNDAHVVFVAKTAAANAPELFSVSSTGGTRAQLSGVGTAGSYYWNPNRRRFLFSPDGTYVTYFTKNAPSAPSVLFSAALASATPTNLSGDVGGAPVLDWEISPDSTRAVFSSGVGVEPVKLQSTLLSGGVPTLLANFAIKTPPLLEGDRWPQISADSRYVAYTAKSVNAGDSPSSIHVQLIDGGEEITLTNSARILGENPFVTGVVTAQAFSFSPDGQRVLFRNDVYFYQGGDLDSSTTNLRSAPISTGVSVDLNPVVPVDRTAMTADSRTVVFQRTLAKEIVAIPIDGGTVVPISGIVPTERSTAQLMIVDDQARVFFISDQAASRRSFELFRAPVGGKPLTLDFDGDDRILAHSDILMLLRRRLAATPAAMSTGTNAINATITNTSTLVSRVDAVLNDRVAISSPLDIDLNGSVGAATDMVMILRYAMGFRGRAITQGAIGAPSTFPQRTDPAAIENHLRYLFTTYELSGQG